MNAWLTVLKQGFLQSRVVWFLMAVWLAGATAMTAALWPECIYPFESMAGMGWRLPSIGLVTLGILVWAALRHGLDTQLSPAAVQLVPGLRRAVVIVTIVLWLVMATALGLETCVYGVPFQWIFVALLVLMTITVSRRPSWRKGTLVALPLLWAPIYGYRFPLPSPDATPWLAWIATPLAITMGAAFIVSELGKGADAHPFLYGRLVRPQPHGEREVRAQWVWDAILRRPKTFQWLFDRMVVARSPEVRVLQGLGTAFHWSHAVLGIIFQAVPMCLVTYATSWLLFARELGDDHSFEPVINIASIGAFFFAILLADFRMRELYARRKEQALLILLPGAPTGRDVNRWLIQTLVLQHAMAVVSALWFVVAVAFALQQPLESTLKMIAPPLVASLFTTAVFVRDYARMRQPRRLQYLLLAGILIAPLYWALHFRRGDPIIVIVEAVLLGGTVAAWRYARFADAPSAFPVGRLAA